jgi:hypothetical protein
VVINVVVTMMVIALVVILVVVYLVFFCLTGCGLLGSGVGYYCGILLFSALFAARHGFYQALAGLHWCIKLVLPVIVIPGIAKGRLLFGLIVGLFVGLLLGLVYVLFGLGKCDHCSRPLSGGGGVTQCNKCGQRYCFDCCFRSRIVWPLDSRLFLDFEFDEYQFNRRRMLRRIQNINTMDDSILN